MVLGALFAAAAAPPVPWSLLLFYGVLAVLLPWLAVRLLDHLWWRPRRLERALRVQGLGGTPYRFLTGDLKEFFRMNKEAESRQPLPSQCHDIAAHVAPFAHRVVTEHGRLSFSWFGPVPKVTITDPGLARDVLANKFGHFEKPRFRAVSRLFAEGVASHEGEKWVKHRRILNPAFHLEKLKLMVPAIAASCEELVAQWTQQSLSSDGDLELDVVPDMKTLTGDVISRTAFGSSYLEGRRIFELQSEQIDRLMSIIHKFGIPGYMYLPTKNNRRMRQIRMEINAILQAMIGKRMEAMKQGEIGTKDDLLGLLLESNMRHTEENETGQQPSMRMSIDDIIEECKLFYFAGMETTSVLLTWTMVLLSMHPEWQDRAREEVLGLFGKSKPGYDGLSRLKTVTMILYEVLRLYPPATVFSRKTYKEMEIGGVTLPAGVMVELSALFIHHDAAIWGDDVHEFRPDRFAEGITKASKDKQQVAFFPFGWGPRICIGQNFALLEAKMAVAMILQSFQFELAPTYTHAPHPVMMLRPMHGAQIKLRPI